MQILKRAIAEGQLPPDLDLSFSVALLIGPMMYRHVLLLSKSKLPDDMPERIVEAFWKAYAMGQSRALRRTR